MDSGPIKRDTATSDPNSETNFANQHPSGLAEKDSSLWLESAATEEHSFPEMLPEIFLDSGMLDSEHQQSIERRLAILDLPNEENDAQPY